MIDEVYGVPSEVTAAEGNVFVNGPDGVDIMFTPEAAAETSDRLLEGAMQATGQRIEVKRREEEERDRRA